MSYIDLFYRMSFVHAVGLHGFVVFFINCCVPVLSLPTVIVVDAKRRSIAQLARYLRLRRTCINVICT